MLNSEKYTTVKKRAIAFDVYCRKICTNEDGYCNHAECAFSWLDREAEEEKTEDCPFCGSNTVVKSYVTVRHEDNHLVECTNCQYRSEEKFDRDCAIAAHNRVARAVMEVVKKEGK